MCVCLQRRRVGKCAVSRAGEGTFATVLVVAQSCGAQRSSCASCLVTVCKVPSLSRGLAATRSRFVNRTELMTIPKASNDLPAILGASATIQCDVSRGFDGFLVMETNMFWQQQCWRRAPRLTAVQTSSRPHTSVQTRALQIADASATPSLRCLVITAIAAIATALIPLLPSSTCILRSRLDITHVIMRGRCCAIVRRC